MSASEPVPPTDVRIVSPDGAEQPVEVAHVGADDDGVAVWVNAHPMPDGFGPGWRITCALLPPRTTIRLGGSAK